MPPRVKRAITQVDGKHLGQQVLCGLRQPSRRIPSIHLPGSSKPLTSSPERRQGLSDLDPDGTKSDNADPCVKSACSKSVSEVRMRLPNTYHGSGTIGLEGGCQHDLFCLDDAIANRSTDWGRRAAHGLRVPSPQILIAFNTPGYELVAHARTLLRTSGMSPRAPPSSADTELVDLWCWAWNALAAADQAPSKACSPLRAQVVPVGPALI